MRREKQNELAPRSFECQYETRYENCPETAPKILSIVQVPKHFSSALLQHFSRPISNTKKNFFSLPRICRHRHAKELRGQNPLSFYNCRENSDGMFPNPVTGKVFFHYSFRNTDFPNHFCNNWAPKIILLAMDLHQARTAILLSESYRHVLARSLHSRALRHGGQC